MGARAALAGVLGCVGFHWGLSGFVGYTAGGLWIPLMMKEGDFSSGECETWDGLEAKVDALVGLNRRLAEENAALRRQQQDWSAERTALVNKIEMAKSRVETLIMRYKSLRQD